MALAATAYLALLGPQGLRQVGKLCVQKANYAFRRLRDIPGWTAPYEGHFVKEFVLQAPIDPIRLNRALLEYKIIGGLPLARWDAAMSDAILFCVTEARTRTEIDLLVDAVRQITENEGA